LIIGEMGRQKKGGQPHIWLWHPHIFGKPPRVQVGSLKKPAHGETFMPAIMTIIARNVMGNHHSISTLESGNPIPYCCDLPADLMTKHCWRQNLALNNLQDITPTQATTLNPHQ
jgi:hypothetical protein